MEQFYVAVCIQQKFSAIFQTKYNSKEPKGFILNPLKVFAFMKPKIDLYFYKF